MELKHDVSVYIYFKKNGVNHAALLQAKTQNYL